MRALPFLSALSALAMNPLSPATPLGLVACHSSQGRADGTVPPAGEVWLKEEDVQRLGLTTEEVRLEQVDETIVAVGPVVDGRECPAKPPPEKAATCVVVTVEQSALGRIRVDGLATARATNLVHDVFPGRVAWIAGALEPKGRTVKVACLFPDPMTELRPRSQLRIELVVGTRPAFAVSRSAVLQATDGPFVFSSEGTASDGRHRYARVSIRPAEDTGGPWLPVTDLRPGSVVVRSGARTLASMLTVTSL